MTPELKVLYISLDGMTDPLGRSQVLPYLVGLAARGHRITLLSMEKPGAYATDAAKVREITGHSKIRWVPVLYRQKPPIVSRAWNVHALRKTADRLQRENGFDLLHCRSYIPAAVGLHLRRKYGVPFLFDMRGFFPDERVEGGSWPQSNPFFRLLYLRFKRLESVLLRSASHIITLTKAGQAELARMTGGRASAGMVTVIPCCVDFSHFPLITPERRLQGRMVLGIAPESRVMAYLGSVGSWYMLDEMLDFFKLYRHRFPDTVFLFVTPSPPQFIIEAATRKGVNPASILIQSASRDDVPKVMATADLGVFFIRPVFSKTASSPTKMAELIALGLPIVTNDGVGDVSELIKETGCGVAVNEFKSTAYIDAIERLEALHWDPAEVRARARPIFDVDIGTERYDACYRKIVHAK